MPSYYKTASSRILKDKYKKYEELCAKKGLSMHMDLKHYIEATLAEGMKNNERIENRLETGNEKNIHRSIKGNLTGHDQNRAKHVETSNADIPPFILSIPTDRKNGET